MPGLRRQPLARPAGIPLSHDGGNIARGRAIGAARSVCRGRLVKRSTGPRPPATLQPDCQRMIHFRPLLRLMCLVVAGLVLLTAPGRTETVSAW